jgi:integrase
LRDDYLDNVNQASVGIGGAILFRDFARIYERDVLPAMASTTRNRSKSVLKVHLKPEFGDKMLRELSSVEILQAYFTSLQARIPETETVDKIRDVMSAVLGAAVVYQRLKTNPMDKIRLKRRRRTKPKPFIRVDQFYALLELIEEPYSSMIYVAVFTALRVSEIAGLVWRNVHADTISVEQRYCRGDWDEPKSEASRATIAVDGHVIDRIQRLKLLEVVVRAGRARRRYPAVKSDGPDDLVFQSPVKGAPMRDNNVLVRHIKPAGRKLGIGFVNWQVLRRSCATWLDQAKVSVKDAQGILRHSRASTTQDVYQQVVPESQRKAVRKLTAFVRGTSKEAV